MDIQFLCSSSSFLPLSLFASPFLFVFASHRLCPVRRDLSAFLRRRRPHRHLLQHQLGRRRRHTTRSRHSHTTKVRGCARMTRPREQGVVSRCLVVPFFSRARLRLCFSLRPATHPPRARTHTRVQPISLGRSSVASCRLPLPRAAPLLPALPPLLSLRCPPRRISRDCSLRDDSPTCSHSRRGKRWRSGEERRGDIGNANVVDESHSQTELPRIAYDSDADVASPRLPSPHVRLCDLVLCRMAASRRRTASSGSALSCSQPHWHRSCEDTEDSSCCTH